MVRIKIIQNTYAGKDFNIAASHLADQVNKFIKDKDVKDIRTADGMNSATITYEVSEELQEVPDFNFKKPLQEMSEVNNEN